MCQVSSLMLPPIHEQPQKSPSWIGLRKGLCDYSNAYILVKETIRVRNTAEDWEVANNDNKKVVLNTGRINNTHDVVTLMYKQYVLM